MRHKIGGAAYTGLGNPSPALIDGQPTEDQAFNELVNACAADAYEIFFKGTKLDYEYCDAGIRGGEIRLGIEPAYMYEELKMICLNENKKRSRVVTGYAWGAYGSGIRQTVRAYGDYKLQSKFVRFVDKWHDKLFHANAGATTT